MKQFFPMVLVVIGLSGPVAADETATTADVRFSATEVKEVANFRKHVVPLLGKLGCNGRVGKSDDKATLPADKGFSPDDVAASFYHNLGIDHTKEYYTNIGRPIMIVRDGHVIAELFT